MKKVSIVLTVLLSCFAPGLSAQDLESGYFLGGNPYAFRLNPAFQSERNIFSIFGAVSARNRGCTFEGYVYPAGSGITPSWLCLT